MRSLASQGPRSSEARLRLQRLEDAVTGLIQNGTKSNHEGLDRVPSAILSQNQLHTTDISYGASPETSTRGHLDINGSETQYLGPTHWTTILEDVSLMRPVFKISQTDVPRSTRSKVT